MRTVEVSRFVRATPRELERTLDPATVLDYEGTFTVTEIEETGDGQRVTARATGMEAVFRFEARDGALAYEQVGDSGPFAEMRTELGYEPENEGSRVTARSAVSLGLPLPVLTDRIAAWKRRGELKRALRSMAADLA